MILQTLVDWLKTCPLIDGDVTVDFTGCTPGSVGLYPAGVELLERREDVLGGVTSRYRCSFDLHRVTTGQQDSPEQAAWLLRFQDWVNSQSQNGPTFGSEKAREHIRAEKGKLKSTSQTGTGTYTVRLTAEYVIKGE